MGKGKVGSLHSIGAGSYRKFNYILRNPWDSGVARQNEDYPWVWAQEDDRRKEIRFRGTHALPEKKTTAFPISSSARMRCSTRA